MASLDIRAEHRQSQTLSPRLQHAVRLLQMSSLDFSAMVRDKLSANPFLEFEDEEGGGPSEAGDHDTEPGALDEPSLPLAAETAAATADVETVAIDGDAALPLDADDRDLWQAGIGGTRPADDGELSAMEGMAVETLLNTHLHGQLNVLPLSERDLVLARAVVESLDDDGYLRCTLEEIAAAVPLAPPATAEELQIALRRVQSLEPAGVGARSVGECLQLQLHQIECEETRRLAQQIVDESLESLAARDVPALARRLRATPARVEEVCARIRRLDPRPGWRFGSSHVSYVVPDVIVKRVRGQWTVQLNPAVVPKVRLNHVYADLFQRHRNPGNGEMAGHLQDARWTLHNVEQRFSTILDVAQAIVRRQRHFLEYGAMAMKPLILREIAEEVGVHESTVSRVTNNKYMATPIGVFELKYFFSRPMVSANGSACSGTAIRGLIKDIIEGERREEPLSDAEIARQLAGQGLVVARRTVTKYRQMLHIEPMERRRLHR